MKKIIFFALTLVFFTLILLYVTFAESIILVNNSKNQTLHILAQDEPQAISRYFKKYSKTVTIEPEGSFKIIEGKKGSVKEISGNALTVYFFFNKNSYANKVTFLFTDDGTPTCNVEKIEYENDDLTSSGAIDIIESTTLIDETTETTTEITTATTSINIESVDINNDKQLDTEDTINILSFIDTETDKTQYTLNQIEKMDTNKDNEINKTDADELLKQILNNDYEIPTENNG